uniref:Uncharacterized protein n=1 Tax=Arundo donax TaxID=35708 RepID=A0A0A9FJM0_ARUDO
MMNLRTQVITYLSFHPLVLEPCGHLILLFQVINYLLPMWTINYLTSSQHHIRL